MKSKQRGFHVIELAIVVLVLGLLGFVGYKVWDRSQNGSDSGSSSQAAPVVPDIKTADDLTAAEKAVDQADIASGQSELTSMESELDSLE